MVRTMQQKTSVGPKGQIVIPKIFRQLEKISPGDDVILELEEDKIVLRKQETYDTLRIMEQIAKSIAEKHKRIKVDSDKDYEEMLEERWKKTST